MSQVSPDNYFIQQDEEFYWLTFSILGRNALFALIFPNIVSRRKSQRLSTL
jgi:hypothetical protein